MIILLKFDINLPMHTQLAAVYPGSFDPPTNGHLDIITRASRLFPKIIVAVTDNASKKHMFSLEQRVDLLKKSAENLPNVDF